MSPGELILVSVDDHVVEPPNLFDRHLAAQWRDRAPKMVKNQEPVSMADAFNQLAALGS